jgi:hypothetical protein
MEKKIFDVIPIEDYAVVITKEDPNRGDSVLGTNTNFLRINTITATPKDGPYNSWIIDAKDMVQRDCIDKIIATIGKRIEGIPLIELPDREAEIIESLTQSVYAKQVIDWDINLQKHVDFLRNILKSGITIGYRAAQKGTIKQVVLDIDDSGNIKLKSIIYERIVE